MSDATREIHGGEGPGPALDLPDFTGPLDLLLHLIQ